MKRQNSIESTEVFEWYDGLVLGLVRAKDLVALAFLLAYDPDRERKKFCLIPLSVEQANELRTLFKEKGPQALNKKAFSKFFARNGRRLLTCDEPKEGATLEFTEATTAEIARLDIPSFPVIDRAVASTAITQWLKS